MSAIVEKGLAVTVIQNKRRATKMALKFEK